MRTPRTLTAVLMCASPVLVTMATAAPAQAHGATDDPPSRALFCSVGSPYEQTEVCRAALAASNRAEFEDWDNIRVANVNGRDREVIQDGLLCSAGLPEFAGLDLARADWPTTAMEPGARYDFSYAVTIPHQGTFRLYVTRDGYDPEQPLTWSDLEPEPFLTSTDPDLVNDTYRMPGRLPEGRTGRHVIYTIWQTADTPDTYYSCSDVVFGDPPAGSDDSGNGEDGNGGGGDGGGATSGPADGSRAAGDSGSAELVGLNRSTGQVAGSAAVLLVLVAVAVSLARGRRSSY